MIAAEETVARLDDEHLAQMEGLRRARAVGVRAFVARFFSQPFAVAGAVLLGIVTLAAILAPLIAPYDPFSLHRPLQPMSSAHWLGTDPIGHDILSMIIWGGRVSLAFAFGAAALSLAVGVVMGAIPGYFGGIVDDIFSRFFETFHVIPNGLAPVIANSTLQMAYAVLTEAGLSFLGLGDVNQVSWGQILNAGQGYVRSAPWIVISPGLAIMTLLLGLHLVGDGVTRVLNPRLSLGRE